MYGSEMMQITRYYGNQTDWINDCINSMKGIVNAQNEHRHTWMKLVFFSSCYCTTYAVFSCMDSISNLFNRWMRLKMQSNMRLLWLTLAYWMILYRIRKPIIDFHSHMNSTQKTHEFRWQNAISKLVFSFALFFLSMRSNQNCVSKPLYMRHKAHI